MSHETERKSFMFFFETIFVIRTQVTSKACLDFSSHLLPICLRYLFAKIRIVCICFSSLFSLHRLSQICNPKHSYRCGLSQANSETVWIIVMPVTRSFLCGTVATDVRIALSSPTPPHFSSFAL